MLKISLLVLLLALGLFEQLFKAFFLGNSRHDGLDIMDLTLTPVVHLLEGVLLVGDHMAHLILERLCVWIVEDHLVWAVLGVAIHIEVFVLVEDAHKYLVVCDLKSLVIAEVSQILLQRLHLHEDFLGKEGELSHNAIEALFISKIVHTFVDISDFTGSLNHSSVGDTRQAVQHLFDISG